jgi:hypothetical protein
VLGGRISKVDPSGNVTTVVNALPSSQTAAAIGGLVTGVTSVAFIDDHLYGLLVGAGCSHGVPDVPNGVFKVHRDGTWSLIVGLGAFIQANPVANPDEDDFEPDGTWYSMISMDGALYPMDSNHGELDRVTPDGSISRVLDISAVVGHVVPTALAFRRHLVISNLGLFEPSDGAGDEHVYKLSRHGVLKDVATGVEKVLGLAFRGRRLYALETSTTAGLPTRWTRRCFLRLRAGLRLPCQRGTRPADHALIAADRPAPAPCTSHDAGAGAGLGEHQDRPRLHAPVRSGRDLGRELDRLVGTRDVEHVEADDLLAARARGSLGARRLAIANGHRRRRRRGLDGIAGLEEAAPVDFVVERAIGVELGLAFRGIRGREAVLVGVQQEEVLHASPSVRLPAPIAGVR